MAPSTSTAATIATYYCIPGFAPRIVVDDRTRATTTVIVFFLLEFLLTTHEALSCRPRQWLQVFATEGTARLRNIILPQHVVPREGIPAQTYYMLVHPSDLAAEG